MPRDFDEDDFEAWEAHYELHQSEDYPALIALCESEVRADPQDLHAHERLGHAYVLNGDHHAAICAMTPIHRRHPDLVGFAYIILDALFASGKTEDDFSWSRRPTVLHLGPDVVDFCYDFLRLKRRSRSVVELHTELLLEGYLTFTADELLEGLARDVRFDVSGGRLWDSKICVVRKGKRKLGKTSSDG